MSKPIAFFVQKMKHKILGSRPRRFITRWHVMRPMGACHAMFGVAQMSEASFETEAEALQWIEQYKTLRSESELAWIRGIGS